MRKGLITPEAQSAALPNLNWLDLLSIARAEITSEDALHPIESALNIYRKSGWRASEPGSQTIRLIFDEPQNIKRVHLVFCENERQRTQEFVLQWYQDYGRSYREIVRQQYNFNPPEAIRETENYTVDLVGVTTLELIIVPDINGGNLRASLAWLRLA